MDTKLIQDETIDHQPLGPLTELLNHLGVDYEIMPRFVTGLGCPIAKDSEIDPPQMAQLTILKVKKLFIQVLHSFDSILDLNKLKKVVSSAVCVASAKDLTKAAFLQGLKSSLALPISSHLFYLDHRLQNCSQLYIRVHEKACLIRINLKDLKKLIATINVEDIASPFECFNDQWTLSNDEADVTNAIESFTQRRMKSRLEDTLELPPIPQIATALIALRSDERANTDDLVSLVEKDPALAAQIVSWASSPYYGARGVTSVKDAIVRVLGYEVVLNLSLGLALTLPFNMPTEGPFGLYPFWEETIAVAHLMESVAKIAVKSGVVVPVGFAYLSGLLANFGTFILAQVFPSFYDEINQWCELNPHVSECYLDRMKLGVSRECLAAQLFKSWGLPQPVVNAVRWQHHLEYEGEDSSLAKLLFFCHQLVRSQGIVYKHVQPLVESTIRDFGLEPNVLDELIDRLPEAFDDLSGLEKFMR